MAESTEKALKQNAQLIIETHELVENNKLLVQAEEKHHKQNLTPLCVLDIDPLYYLPETDHFIKIQGGYFKLMASVVNNGLGPAKNITLIVRCAEKEQRVPIPPIGPSGRFVGSECSYGMSGTPSRRHEIDFKASEMLYGLAIETSLQKLCGDGNVFEIFIEYEDLFDKTYLSRYENSDNSFKFDGLYIGKLLPHPFNKRMYKIFSL
jgi:hypothetical protein